MLLALTFCGKAFQTYGNGLSYWSYSLHVHAPLSAIRLQIATGGLYLRKIGSRPRTDGAAGLPRSPQRQSMTGGRDSYPAGFSKYICSIAPLSSAAPTFLPHDYVYEPSSSNWRSRLCGSSQ